MKLLLIALFAMVFVLIIYDWTMPFVPAKFHAIGASLWVIAIFGYISIRVINDGINSAIAIHRKMYFAFGSYFVIRTVLNSITFVRGLYPEGSWEFYRYLTSNYYLDVVIWTLILVILLWMIKKDIMFYIKKPWGKAKIT